MLPTVRYGYCDAENVVRRKMERKFMKENCAKAERKPFDKSLVEGFPYRGMQKILIYLQRYRLRCLDQIVSFWGKKSMSHTQSSEGHSRLFNMEVPQAIRDEIQRTKHSLHGRRKKGRRRGGGREKSAKGKSEGSACSESLCFCNAHQFSSDPITFTVNQVSLHSPITTQG